MPSDTTGNAFRSVEPTRAIRYLREGMPADDSRLIHDNNNNNNNNTRRNTSPISTGLSAYSPPQIGGASSSIGSELSSRTDHRDDEDDLSTSISSIHHHDENNNDSIHPTAHHLDLALTPHPCTKMCQRAFAGNDGGAVAEKDQSKLGEDVRLPENARTTSSTQSVIRFPDEPEVSVRSTTEPSVERPRRESSGNDKCHSGASSKKGRSSQSTGSTGSAYSSNYSSATPSYLQSTVSSRAHARSRNSVSKVGSSRSGDLRNRSLSAHTISMSDSELLKKPDSKPSTSSRLGYHGKPTHREKFQQSDVSKWLSRDEDKSKTEEKDDSTMVFTVRKWVLLDLLKTLYDQSDDTIIAIQVKKENLRTLSEHEASKKRRRERQQRLRVMEEKEK